MTASERIKYGIVVGARVSREARVLVDKIASRRGWSITKMLTVALSEYIIKNENEDLSIKDTLIVKNLLAGGQDRAEIDFDNAQHILKVISLDDNENCQVVIIKKSTTVSDNLVATSNSILEGCQISKVVLTKVVTKEKLYEVVKTFKVATLSAIDGLDVGKKAYITISNMWLNAELQVHMKDYKSGHTSDTIKLSFEGWIIIGKNAYFTSIDNVVATLSKYTQGILFTESRMPFTFAS